MSEMISNGSCQSDGASERLKAMQGDVVALLLSRMTPRRELVLAMRANHGKCLLFRDFRRLAPPQSLLACPLSPRYTERRPNRCMRPVLAARLRSPARLQHTRFHVR